MIVERIFWHTTKGRKGSKMIRLCFSAHLYLIGWIIFSSPQWSFLPAAVVSILFCCERWCQSPAVFPYKKGTPSKHWLDTMHHISALLWFFFFHAKTLCITNAIWLAGAIVWKKVGPFRWVSRKAFKLSPRSLLPSYRNLLEALFAGLDNGVWTLFPYSDFCCWVILQ